MCTTFYLDLKDISQRCEFSDFHVTDVHGVHALQVTLAAISDCFSEEVSYRSLKYLITLFTTRV